MYAPRVGVREGRGIALFEKGRIQIVAPDDYSGEQLTDPSTEAGYFHSYLRPYQAALRGRSTARGDVVRFRALHSIGYVLVESNSINGLRCAGAISLSKAKRGYTFSFFPAMPRRPLRHREVDHLSAHIDFVDGNITIGKLQARIRFEGESYSRGVLPLDNVRHDDHHFAFEYWAKGVEFLDPAGSVSSSLKSIWTSREDQKELRKLIEQAQPVTFACSIPTRNGLVPASCPILLRVGVLTERGRREKGGTDRALSQPLGAAKPTPARVHRYRNPSLIEPNWPPDASIFFELAIAPTPPPMDYVLPDIKRTSLEGLNP